ncbi:MAG: hypothetical protein WCZ89_09645 [Phycisphaerae bacterium]
MIRFAKVGIILALTATLFFVYSFACSPNKKERTPVNNYPFYETTIDKLPDLQNVRGILIMAYKHPSVPCYILAIGELNDIQKIVGFDLIGNDCKLLPVENNNEWIAKILTACNESIRQERISAGSDSRIAFVTLESTEMLQFDMDENRVFGNGYESVKLKEYLLELFERHNIKP